MKVIGLTGGIGTGKSTVAKYLAELGAAVLDLDKIGHEVMKSDSPAYQRIVSEFGKDILDTRGEIDRARLAKIVFKEPESLRRLNRIVHPGIDKIIDERISAYRQQGVKVLVLEGAAMLEAGKAKQADEIWITTAPEEVVLKRLNKRSGYSEKESRARMRSQLSDKERIKRAKAVIDTGGSMDEVRARVEKEWEALMGRSGE